MVQADFDLRAFDLRDEATTEPVDFEFGGRVLGDGSHDEQSSMAKRGPKGPKPTPSGWYVWDTKLRHPYIYVPHETEEAAEATRADLLRYYDAKDPWQSRLKVVRVY